MDALKALVGAQGCAPDGGAAAMNPMTGLLERITMTGPPGIAGAAMAAPAGAGPQTYEMMGDGRTDEFTARMVHGPGPQAWGPAHMAPMHAAAMSAPPPHMAFPGYGAAAGMPPPHMMGHPMGMMGMPHPMMYGGPVMAPMTAAAPIAAEPVAAVVEPADSATTSIAAPATASADEMTAKEWSEQLSRALGRDPSFVDSELVGFMRKLSKGELEFKGNTVVPGPAAATAADPMQATWDRLSNVDTETMDYTQLAEAMQAMAEAEQRAATAGGDASTAAFWGFEPEELTKGYKFDKTAVPSATDQAATDAFERGCQLFKEGKLHEARLAFESVLLHNEDHSEAWRMLGSCHAENDQDVQAILCLENAIKFDPYNLDALLALGVSYVNDLQSEKALACLQMWVQHNPKFHGLKVPEDAYSDGSQLDEVMRLMMAASRWDAKDPEVQVVLGVLFNVSRDYASAVMAFETALQSSPDDYTLWNKLGATLANGKRSGEALGAYRRALELKPTYARAWLNLGISHANLHNYKDACRAYISALRLNPNATHIWTYLRISLSCLGRGDLIDQTLPEDVRVLDSFEL